jgi:hypothetical protein
MKTGKAGINFQTSLSLEEVIVFYRNSFTIQGLVERSPFTVINDDSFSIVFDGAPNGKTTVVQGVALVNNTSNVSIRYEDN